MDEATDIMYVHMCMVADIGNSSPIYIYLVVYWFVDYSLLYVLGSGCITTRTLLFVCGHSSTTDMNTDNKTVVLDKNKDGFMHVAISSIYL